MSRTQKNVQNETENLIQSLKKGKSLLCTFSRNNNVTTNKFKGKEGEAQFKKKKKNLNVKPIVQLILRHNNLTYM